MAEETTTPAQTANTTTPVEIVEKPFDPKAFISGIQTLGKEETTTPPVEKPAVETEKPKEEPEEKPMEFSWDIDEKPEVKPESVTEPVDNKGAVEKNTTNPVGVVEKPSTFDFNTVAKELELGEDVKDIPSLKAKLAHYQKIEKEQEQLRSLAKKGAANAEIEALQNTLAFNDEQLVSAELKAKKISDEDIKEYIDAAKANNTLKSDAIKIRATLNQFLDQKREAVVKAAAGQEETSHAEQIAAKESADKRFKEEVNKHEEIFGFKLSNKPENVQKVRDELSIYVTTGSFLKDIVKDDKSLMEAAHLWKNRETLFKALQNKGVNQGKKEILDKIKQPETAATTRIIDASNETQEFNISKFLTGVGQKPSQ